MEQKVTGLSTFEKLLIKFMHVFGLILEENFMEYFVHKFYIFKLETQNLNVKSFIGQSDFLDKPIYENCLV